MRTIEQLVDQQLTVKDDGTIESKKNVTRVTQKISLGHKNKLESLADTLGMSLGDIQTQAIEYGLDQIWETTQAKLKSIKKS